MNILCLNTCFAKTYVSLKTNMASSLTEMDSSLKQSENVLTAIDNVLSEQKLNFKDLNVVSCVIGPGSFTGIRIGASLLKGACFPHQNIKKIEINSLDLLAYSFASKHNPEEDFWVVLNALSGNLFARKYNCKADPLTETSLCYGEELNQINGVVVGDKEEHLSICNNFESFNCEDLLSMTIHKLNNEEFSKDFTPLYIRKSQAEQELEKKCLQNN